jgi:hypothetical protein
MGFPLTSLEVEAGGSTESRSALMRAQQNKRGRRERARPLFAEKKQRGAASGADNEQGNGVGDEIRINHQHNPAEHRLPQVESLAVNEGDEPNGPKKETADQITGAEIEHLPIPELELGQGCSHGAGRRAKRKILPRQSGATTKDRQLQLD